MSRPINCSAVLGFRPSTGVVVEVWKNSGTICTRPPTLTMRMVSTISRPRFFSMFSCEIMFGLLSGVDGLRDGGVIDDASGSAGLPDVPGHHQHAAEEQRPAGEADAVERMHGGDHLGVAVG